MFSHLKWNDIYTIIWSFDHTSYEVSCSIKVYIVFRLQNFLTWLMKNKQYLNIIFWICLHYTGRSLRAREIIIVANYLPYKDAELNLIPTTVIKAENNGLYLKSKPWRGGDNSICGFCGHNVYLHWQTPYPSDRKIRLGAIERESTLSSGPHLHVRS